MTAVPTRFLPDPSAAFAQSVRAETNLTHILDFWRIVYGRENSLPVVGCKVSQGISAVTLFETIQLGSTGPNHNTLDPVFRWQVLHPYDRERIASLIIDAVLEVLEVGVESVCQRVAKVIDHVFGFRIGLPFPVVDIVNLKEQQTLLSFIPVPTSAFRRGRGWGLLDDSLYSYDGLYSCDGLCGRRRHHCHSRR